MQSTKSADLIGHSKFLLWRQLDGCSVTRPFLSLQRVQLARLQNIIMHSRSVIGFHFACFQAFLWLHLLVSGSPGEIKQIHRVQLQVFKLTIRLQSRDHMPRQLQFCSRQPLPISGSSWGELLQLGEVLNWKPFWWCAICNEYAHILRKLGVARSLRPIYGIFLFTAHPLLTSPSCLSARCWSPEPGVWIIRYQYAGG